MKNILIKGARLHNLKNIDVLLPKNKLIAATGVSGSGKSSLVFDIIYEEGKRRYLNSLGVYAGVDEEEKFDSIEGLGPTVAVRQNVVRQNNPRSTVGSRTNIINLLAQLYESDGETSNDEKTERLFAGYFSYNNPNGMCLRCGGRGAFYQIDLEKLDAGGKLTTREIFAKVKPSPGYAGLLNRHFAEYLDLPFSNIADDIKGDILYGRYSGQNASRRSVCLERILAGQVRKYGKDPLGCYSYSICPDCRGSRIGEESRRVLISGKHIGELAVMGLVELNSFAHKELAVQKLSSYGTNLIAEIERKTRALIGARLGHLSLYREISSLSGGEIQRLFLFERLDSGVGSLIYIFDEPTAGLHESEKIELIETLEKLKNGENTVIVVEHDLGIINRAEYIIDLGPNAGPEGGEIIYQGEPAGLANCPGSITGQYLFGEAAMPKRKCRPPLDSGFCLEILGAKTNNLKNINISIPLGVIVGIAGVSGSGKSSLVSDTLLPMLKANLNNLNETGEDEARDSLAPDIKELRGIKHIRGCAEVLQEPIGRSRNSNPVSYIGTWDKIRKIYASQALAKEKGFSAGHFSFNSRGACQSCGGSGREKMWLGADLFFNNPCPECHGKRFNEEALSVTYRGKNIFDILEMSVTEAAAFFGEFPGVCGMLKILERTGMGYIKLGQPTPELSGGEAQRIKLAREIGKRRKGNILYAFDEPTAGLSPSDTARLILLLDELASKGNSLIVIEHDINVLSICDWIIELGPGGGNDGGHIIAEGRPEELKNNSGSITGRYLK